MRPLRWVVPLGFAVVASLSALAAQQPTFTVERFDIGGEGGTDYLTTDPATGRVFISRGSHVMVVDGAAGAVLGDIPDTPRVHGIALVPKWHRGFTTNAGDSTVTIFDLATLRRVGSIAVPVGGLDGIMYDGSVDRVILTNHSRPRGTAVSIDPSTGTVVGTALLQDTAPEGAASDGHGRLFVNNEGTSTVEVVDAATMTVQASWPLAPCEGPTGIAYDVASARVLSGCSGTSVVVDPGTGRVVATMANGDGVDALGWDPAERLVYIPAGRAGTVTIAHQDDPDHYTVVATVATVPGAKTIAVDPIRHMAYLFQPEYGPPPTPASGAPTGGRGPRGPIVHAWFVVIRH
jgi:DNA-binding beta-propeller fold protein YncE